MKYFKKFYLSRLWGGGNAKIYKDYAKNFKKGIERINYYCNELEISDQTKLDAIELFKKILGKKLTLGRSVDDLIITSIYISCQFNQEPVPLTFIAQKCERPKIKISKRYRAILKELDLKIPPPDLNRYLEHFGKKLNLNNDVFNTAKSLISEILKYNIEQGKEPCSIIGAVIYIAGLLCGDRYTQYKISKLLKVSKATIRARYQEIREKLNLFIL